ncbi:hypothetical protein BN1723_014262 [Verticillium longisporum]|uniref:U3 small nucleolar RNA-associated protein 25 n=1 Tax=Verticillium longisporum TaxID=100787 RepID=A0A0G4M4U0_VERLO|nr:hypothetical protein BN1723_014262 [Verticillium longisporum]
MNAVHGQSPDEKLLEAMSSQKDRLFLLRLEAELIKFVQNSKEPFMDFPPSNSFCRMLTHKLADYYHMTHQYEPRIGSVRIFRTPYARVPDSLASIGVPEPVSETPPPVMLPRKIMRRGEDVESGTVSGVLYKVTSEDGSDGKEKSALANQKEQREEAYKQARERIFGNSEKTGESTPVQGNEWATSRHVTKLSRAVLMSPKVDGAEEAKLPSPITGPDGLKLKMKLKEVVSRKLPSFDPVQQSLAPMLFNYQDILFGDRNVRNSDSLRQITCLHAINHVLKTRDRVIKNTYKLSKEDNPDLECRDQGFVRPKVLFLLPTRQSCAKMVSTIEDLLEPAQKENRKRFEDAYVDTSEKFRDNKPADFLELFDGNDDDMFRLGVKFTRKTIKYFAQFYNSDILMASPLGLRMAIGSVEDKKATDYDFLSSIEMVIVDQADGLLNQNWEHVEYIFEHLNLQPKDAHGCDFSRVRSWYLEDWAKHFRQTIVLAPFLTPELAELQRTQCHNWAGKVRFQPACAGLLQQLPVHARQTFSRFEAASAERDPDARFAYFTSAIVPALLRRGKDVAGTLIFVPSYLDFVRVRNYFATADALESLSFGNISEYADATDAARARSHFLSGRHKVLLYTERAHHFRRYRLRGVRRVVMYGLPENPLFYREIAGDYLAKSEEEMRLEAGQGTVRVMFSRYDVMKLERIVGSQRVGKMIQERGDTFDFV